MLFERVYTTMSEYLTSGGHKRAGLVSLGLFVTLQPVRLWWSPWFLVSCSRGFVGPTLTRLLIDEVVVIGNHPCECGSQIFAVVREMVGGYG